MREQYLRILNLPPDATEQNIKRAYRRLAKRYHPDRSADPAAHERFVEIAEAYRFLSEPEATLYEEFSSYDYTCFSEEDDRQRQAARLFAQEQAAYSIYQGYRFFITWILILCLIFALLPMQSDNKVVAGATVLLFFVFQLGLLW